MNKIVSSIGFSNDFLLNLITKGEKLDYVLEFSSAGFSHNSKNWKIFKQYKGEKIVHNYFPGYSKEPFVLNLASQNKITLKRSINHCKKCIRETSRHGTLKFYGVHAGFYFEMKPEHLGKKIPEIDTTKIIDYENTFYSSVCILLDYAKQFNVLLLIENNVLTAMNFMNNVIPFLCVDSDGITSFFNKFKGEERLGLLIDTAHLKVSASSLNKDKVEEFKKIEHLVSAIHHSDNDGRSDNNQLINNNYWFLELMNSRLRSIPNTLEMKSLDLKNINSTFNLLGI